jgi:hypothetical protein
VVVEVIGEMESLVVKVSDAEMGEMERTLNQKKLAGL